MSFLDPDRVDMFVEITDEEENCPDCSFVQTINEDLGILADDLTRELGDDEELVAGCAMASAPSDLIFGCEYSSSMNGENQRYFFHVHSNGNLTPDFGFDNDRCKQFHQLMDLDIEDLPNLDHVEDHWDEVRMFLSEDIRDLISEVK